MRQPSGHNSQDNDVMFAQIGHANEQELCIVNLLWILDRFTESGTEGPKVVS